MKGGARFPVRLEYSKLGKIRWISHRDTARAFERAFRICSLPLAFTEGFSPRPRVSFGLALGTGAESTAEYLDVDLARPVDLDELVASVSDALPIGLDVTGAAALSERAPALMDAVDAVEWRAEVTRPGAPLDSTALAALVDRALAAPQLPARRVRKGRETVEDVRPLLRRAAVTGDTSSGAEVELEVVTRPLSIRPDEVLDAVAAATGEPGLDVVRLVRTRQWIERDGARLSPLAADTRPRFASGDRDTREGNDDRSRDHRDAGLEGRLGARVGA